jgi:hypothetical protein
MGQNRQRDGGGRPSSTAQTSKKLLPLAPANKKPWIARGKNATLCMSSFTCVLVGARPAGQGVVRAPPKRTLASTGTKRPRIQTSYGCSVAIRHSGLGFGDWDAGIIGFSVIQLPSSMESVAQATSKKIMGIFLLILAYSVTITRRFGID